MADAPGNQGLNWGSLADALVAHSYTKHQGVQNDYNRPPMGGDSWNINSRADLRARATEFLNDPDTKFYVIKTAEGAENILAINEKQGAVMQIGPNEPQNGTFYRADKPFSYDAKKATVEKNGGTISEPLTALELQARTSPSTMSAITNIDPAAISAEEQRQQAAYPGLKRSAIETQLAKDLAADEKLKPYMTPAENGELRLNPKNMPPDVYDYLQSRIKTVMAENPDIYKNDPRSLTKATNEVVSKVNSENLKQLKNERAVRPAPESPGSGSNVSPGKHPDPLALPDEPGAEPRPTVIEKPSVGQRATGMTLGAFGAIVSGYSLYENMMHGNVAGSAISAANTGVSAVGTLEAIKPGMVGTKIVTVAEKAAVPLMVVSAVYEVATAPEGQKGEAALGAGTGLALSGVLMASGASPLVVVALPAAGAWAVRKEERVIQLQREHNTRMEAIKPDITDHSGLRAYADSLDALMQGAKAEKKAKGIDVSDADFVRTPDGKIDLRNEQNLQFIREYMDQQRASLRKGITDTDQISEFPGFTKDESKLMTNMALEERLRAVETAEAELNHIRVGANLQPADRTPEQLREDANRGVKDPLVEKIAFKYTIHHEGPLGHGDTIVGADGSNPPVPDEVRREWLKNPTATEPIRQVLYKAGTDGKSVFDDKGNPVVDKVIFWKIDDPALAEKNAKNNGQKNGHDVVRDGDIESGVDTNSQFNQASGATQTTPDPVPAIGPVDPAHPDSQKKAPVTAAP